jgi:uncharacterized protein YbjT (DUF2867 family)
MAGINIGIFPASGALGGSTLNHLLDFSSSSSNITAVMRKPENASSKVKESNATLRAADYDNASTLDHAFDGVSVLNIISYPSMTHEFRTRVSTCTEFQLADSIFGLKLKL